MDHIAVIIYKCGIYQEVSEAYIDIKLNKQNYVACTSSGISLVSIKG